MDHTNVSFQPDVDRISFDRYSMTLTPGHGRRVSPETASSRSPRSISSETKRSSTPKPATIEVKLDNNNDYYNSDAYYSIERLRERRRGERDDNSLLSHRVRRFYKDQDELIADYERLHNRGQPEQSTSDEAEKKQLEKTQKLSKIFTKVSLAVNVCLFILKIAGAVMSKSLSVISSVIDSAIDLTTSVILFWAWRKIKNRDRYLYPQGRTRLEPIAIVILSVIMIAASVLVIYESINTIVDNTEFFTKQNTTKTLSEIDMSAFPIVVMVVTAVSKSILFFLCYRVDTPTMSALAEDHRNDVFSNIVALFCGLIGSFAYRNKINQKAIFVDPIGAILISIYIIIMWIRQARDQIQRLTGHTADPKFLSHITWLTYNHSSEIVKIDTVRAFYFGTSYFVEVDIVLPENMPLKTAHDIGESLQKKIEDLSEVERAFVHIDYESDHNPSTEHKSV